VETKESPGGRLLLEAGELNPAISLMSKPTGVLRRVALEFFRLAAEEP
jgi:hypothetical protein